MNTKFFYELRGTVHYIVDDDDEIKCITESQR